MRAGIRVITLASAVGFVLAGCMTPIGGSKNQTKSGSRTGAKSRGSSAAGGSSSKRPEVASADRLKVGTESLQAADLWNGLNGELAAQSKALPDNDFRRFVEQRAGQLIADKIAEMLLYQKASARLTGSSEKGIDRFVDSEIRKTVTEDYGGVQRRYEKLLESRGTSLDDAREKIRREIIIAGFMESEIKPKIGEPTLAELLAAYDAERDSLRRKERRRMSLITIRVLDELPREVLEPTREELAAARERGRAKIRGIHEELRGGSDFSDLARRYSTDLHAPDGGAWGWVSQGSVRERFVPAVSALYALAVNATSDIIETPDDFFLVRCDEIDGGVEPTFESVQPELKERFFRKAYNRLVGDLILELRSQSHLESADLERFHAAAVSEALLRSNREGPPAPWTVGALSP